MEKATEFKNLGNQAFKDKKYEESIEHFTKAIELNPNDHIFYSNRSGSYASLNQYENALNDASKCVEINGSWAKGYVRKGLAEFYLEKYDQAIETYKQGLQLDPANQQLQEGLDRAKEEKEFMEIAGNARQNMPGGMGAGMDNNFMKGMFGKLQENPKTREYLKDKEFMAKLQMMSQNPQMFSVLSQQDPRINEALQVMLGGMDLGNMGNMKPPGEGDNEEESSKMQEEVPEYKPQQQQKPQQQPKKQEPIDEAEQFKLEGNEFYKKKDFVKALELYDKAIEAKPEEILYYNNKAAVFIEQNDLNKALECCQQALQVKEDHMIFDFLKLAKLYARLGSVYEKMGDVKNAKEWYQKSLLEDNNKVIVQSLHRCEAIYKTQEELAYINPELAAEANTKGNELFKEGKFPDAKKNYDEAVRRDPKNPKYYCNRGSSLQKLMEFPCALRDFEKTIELDAQYLKAYGKKGDCHYGMKDYHKAQTAYEKGLVVDPQNNDCKQGLQKVQMAIYSGGGDKEEQEKRASQAMQDPEIQQILMTPEIQNALKAMQTDQKVAMKILQDPVLAPKIQKLIAAGILKMG